MTLPAWLRATVIAILLVALVAVLFLTGWVVQGWRKDAVIADLQRHAAQADQTAALALARASNDARQREQDAIKAQQERENQLIKERDHATLERDQFIAGVRSGAIRLSIPILAPAANTDAADTAAVSGNRHTARAELDPEAAQFLDALAGEGDHAIRQLNACIDTYNDVREKFNVQAR